MMHRGGNKQAPRRGVTRERRTTTDWQKPAAFSYHAQRAERSEADGRQPSSLAAQRHRLLSLHFWFKRSGLLIAIVVALVCVFSILSLSSQPRIMLLDAASKGSYAFHDPAEYQRAAAQNLSTSIWNKNKITINTGAASAALQKQFPELSSVTIAMPLIGHRPVYYLRANDPAFVMQAVNGSFILDAQGQALIATSRVSSATGAKLPVLVDQTGLHAELGKQILSSHETSFITTVIQTLSVRGQVVTSLVLPADAVQELAVQVSGQSYVIKFNMHDTTTARQQVGTYLATASNLTGQHIVPTKYIDVRVPGRAYYQ